MYIYKTEPHVKAQRLKAPTVSSHGEKGPWDVTSRGTGPWSTFMVSANSSREEGLEAIVAIFLNSVFVVCRPYGTVHNRMLTYFSKAKQAVWLTRTKIQFLSS